VTITVDTNDRRDDKALALFAACDRWQTGHTHDGRSFFAIPGSESGLFHMADQRDCSCPDRRQRREVCKHMRAVRFWMAAFKTGTVAPKRAAGANPQDDRVALTPKGAAALAGLSEPVAEHPFISELQTRLEHRALMLKADGCPPDEYRADDEYASIEAKMLDMKAKIATVTAQPMAGYAALMDRHLVEA